MSCNHMHIDDSESRCQTCGITAQGVVYSLHDRILVAQNVALRAGDAERSRIVEWLRSAGTGPSLTASALRKAADDIEKGMHLK